MAMKKPNDYLCKRCPKLGIALSIDATICMVFYTSKENAEIIIDVDYSETALPGSYEKAHVRVQLPKGRSYACVCNLKGYAGSIYLRATSPGELVLGP